jgi:hypothetical protein
MILSYSINEKSLKEAPINNCWNSERKYAGMVDLQSGTVIEEDNEEKYAE